MNRACKYSQYFEAVVARLIMEDCGNISQTFLCYCYQPDREFMSKAMVMHLNKMQPHSMWAAYMVKKCGFNRMHRHCKGLLTFLLTPCSRVLFEKLTGFQLVKKFPEFYVTQRFITAFTNASHLSLSWASLIQSIPPHPTS